MLRSNAARLPLTLLLLMIQACATESTGGSSAVCALPVVHHDGTFGSRLSHEWNKLGAFSANEQIVGEHVRLQDAVEAQCGHHMG